MPGPVLPRGPQLLRPLLEPELGVAAVLEHLAADGEAGRGGLDDRVRKVLLGALLDDLAPLLVPHPALVKVDPARPQVLRPGLQFHGAAVALSGATRQGRRGPERRAGRLREEPVRHARVRATRWRQALRDATPGIPPGGNGRGRHPLRQHVLRGPREPETADGDEGLVVLHQAVGREGRLRAKERGRRPELGHQPHDIAPRPAARVVQGPAGPAPRGVGTPGRRGGRRGLLDDARHGLVALGLLATQPPPHARSLHRRRRRDRQGVALPVAALRRPRHFSPASSRASARARRTSSTISNASNERLKATTAPELSG